MAAAVRGRDDPRRRRGRRPGAGHPRGGFCERKAPGEAAGAVTLALTIGASGKADSVEAQPSALPPAVVDCIVAATKRWQFPATLAGKSFARELVLPVPGRPPGPVDP